MASGPSEQKEHHQRDLMPTEITRSDLHVQRTLDVFKSFINPFQLEKFQPLISLASGATMTEDVRSDVLKALRKGKSQKEEFTSGRLQTTTIPYFTLSKETNLRLCYLRHQKRHCCIKPKGDPIQSYKWIYLPGFYKITGTQIKNKNFRPYAISINSDAIFHLNN